MKIEANKSVLLYFYLKGYRLRFVSLIFSLVISLFATACKNNPSAHSELVEAEFAVDTSLLEQTAIQDSAINLEIRTPLHWIALDSVTTQKLEAGILSGNYLKAKFLKALINQSDSSMMIMLDVSSMDNMYFEELKRNYDKLLNPNKNWNQVQLSEFRLNCFRLQQYVLQSNDMLHFKLIGYEKRDMSNRAHFELMYFISPRNYEKDIKFVESSIGSLNCLTFKK